MQSVSTERHEDVLVIIVNNPPVNALSWHVRQGLSDGFEEGLADPAIRAIVLRCDGKTFIAGADISEIGMPLEGPEFGAVLALIEGAA